MSQAHKRCPICDSSDSRPLRRLYDDRYGYAGEFTLLSCPQCGHRYLDAAFTDEQLTRLYSDYYPRAVLADAPYHPAPAVSGLPAWWRGSARSAFRWVSAGSKVLDIGCGACASLGYLRDIGCQVSGVEADENVRAIAQREGFDVHIGTFDPALYQAGSLDCVTMDQVIEHVSDPRATLQGIARILRPGGTAILSTPNASGWGARLFGARWIHWHAPYHLQHFSRHSMGQAASQAGLEVERVACITDSTWLRYQWLHLLTRPVMGEPSAFWAGQARQTPGFAMRRRLATLVHLSGIDHLLTRLFDALGQGDNQLFILRKPS